MKKVIKEMEKVAVDVRRDLKLTIAEIVALCEKYRYLGKEFTFGVDPDLDANINQALLRLSDQIIDDVDSRVHTAIQEAEADDETTEIMLYIGRDINGETATDRIDKHVSRLKYVIEAFIAIGFANKIYRGSLEHQILLHIINPYTTDLLAQARADALYLASFIRDGDLNSQRGYAKNIVQAISAVGTTMIAEAFHYGRILGYSRDGAIGYGVRRNSSYDCPDCDEVCAVIHPLTEIVVPVHPNCCCSTYPVFPDEI